jgi:hypothetical protein
MPQPAGRGPLPRPAGSCRACPAFVCDRIIDVSGMGGCLKTAKHPPQPPLHRLGSALGSRRSGADGPRSGTVISARTAPADVGQRSRDDLLRGKHGRRISRQVEIVRARVAAAMARTALGATVRVGLRTLVPAAIVAEAAALAAEWTAHQRGADGQVSRRAGEAAGLATSAAVFALAGVSSGPMGVLAGSIAGATMWVAGSATAAAATGAARHVKKRATGGSRSRMGQP